jgi:hypothetical protein
MGRLNRSLQGVSCNLNYIKKTHTVDRNYGTVAEAHTIVKNYGTVYKAHIVIDNYGVVYNADTVKNNHRNGKVLSIDPEIIVNNFGQVGLSEGHSLASDKGKATAEAVPDWDNEGEVRNKGSTPNDSHEQPDPSLTQAPAKAELIAKGMSKPVSDPNDKTREARNTDTASGGFHKQRDLSSTQGPANVEAIAQENTEAISHLSDKMPGVRNTDTTSEIFHEPPSSPLTQYSAKTEVIAETENKHDSKENFGTKRKFEGDEARPQQQKSRKIDSVPKLAKNMQEIKHTQVCSAMTP